MDIKLLILTIMGGVLVNNYVLQQFLGICPFLGVSKKLNQATGMGLAVTAVMLGATAVTYPIQKLLELCKIGYLQTIVFILVIAALVQFVEIVLKKFIPALHKSLGVYLPLITTNCAVLAVAIKNVDTYGGEKFFTGFFLSLVASVGVGLGFLLAMVLFAGVRSRIEKCPSPKCFKGLPITLVSAAIVSLAFFGFAGIVENMVNAIFTK